MHAVLNEPSTTSQCLFSTDHQKAPMKTDLTIANFVPIWDQKYQTNQLTLGLPDFIGKKGIIVFHSPRCPHCKKLHQTLDMFASTREGSDVPIGMVDVNNRPQGTSLLAEYFGVQSLPTIYVYQGGKMMRFGNGSETRVEDIIQALKQSLVPGPDVTKIVDPS